MEQKPVLLLATNHSYMFYRFRRQLIEALQNQYEVVLSTPFTGHEEDLKQLGITLREIQMDRRSINPLKDLKLIQAYRRLLDEIQPDMVITYSIKPNVYLAPLCREKQIPCFVHVQGLGTAFQKPGIAQAARILYRRGTRKSCGVFFENQANCDFFLANRLMEPEQAIVLSGAGVPLEEYPFCERKQEDSVHILYLGRFMKEKGMDELLWALRELRQEGYDFFFDCAGFCEDEYTEQLEQIQKEGWGKSHGFLEDPRFLYEKASFVVLPSWHEGMSNVLLEGAAMGCPLITTDIPGCREAVLEGESGLLCQVKDRQSLKQALETMLLKTPEERQAMGLAGRRHMEQSFSRQKVVQETLLAISQRFSLD